ncbi:MAG: hypothetical protein HY858_10030 [Candidatus Solibacter usitatus]|nr:hypothetical protein [Candidatus Solibacter usitatus]
MPRTEPNESGKPIAAEAVAGTDVLRWYGDVLRVKSGGVEAKRPAGDYSAAVFEPGRAVAPGAWGEIEVEFGVW